MKLPAPIYVRSFDLAAWILQRFDEPGDALGHSLCTQAMQLLDLIALALQNRDYGQRLDEADELLVGLRNRLRLAAQIGRIDDRAMLHGLGLANDIGRQIGALLKAMHKEQ
ncbi:MAG: hypothetical protein N838_02020 [Thiohalocapsa sp. PB-PSB1]|jgi:hypothetical protein|nr:MAG: hypothetical protein N838_02020 [Thiohalocapsa sp. PB-PSB1]HCS92806.1 hypothetical protein [Chromatiaceae bacterium]